MVSQVCSIEGIYLPGHPILPLRLQPNSLATTGMLTPTPFSEHQDGLLYFHPAYSELSFDAGDASELCSLSADVLPPRSSSEPDGSAYDAFAAALQSCTV